MPELPEEEGLYEEDSGKIIGILREMKALLEIRQHGENLFTVTFTLPRYQK